MTELLYLQNPDLHKTSAHIIGGGSDEKGSFVILDRTIFYPQGGGQPSDQGILETNSAEIKIFNVRSVSDRIYHYINIPFCEGLKDQPVVLTLDTARRNLNTRYHSAAHLLSAVTEELYPELKAIKGHHFPGESFVEFFGISQDLDIQKLSSAVARAISQKIPVISMDISKQKSPELFAHLPYELPEGKKLRACRVGKYPLAPCGGTHVRSTNEIGTLVIPRTKSKKGNTKIYYELSHDL